MSEHGTHSGEHRSHGHRREMRITGFKQYKPSKVLTPAVVLSIVSVAPLFLARFTLLPGSDMMPYMVIAHVLGGLGLSILVWAIVSIPDPITKHLDWWACSAAFAVMAYHLTVAAAYLVDFDYGLESAAIAMWGLKTALITIMIRDLLLMRNNDLLMAAVLLLVYCVAGCPFMLSGGFGFLQWFLAKVVTVLLSIQLYRSYMSLYNDPNL